MTIHSPSANTSAPATVLLADDDESICLILAQALRQQGFEVRVCYEGGTLLSWVEQGAGDVVISDVIMPGLDGFAVLRRIRAVRPDLPVIIISAQNSLMTAVESTREGASDYLPKPFDLHELLASVARLAATSRTRLHNIHAGDETPPPLMIGTSPAMQQVYKTMARLAEVDLTVLLEGESGTGKEVVARALHRLGTRRNKPFVPLNVAAIPRELVESELFGHEKGAFTGALARKAGTFAQAAGGTLFLDEIGDMPLEAQTRLLRVLQENEYTPVGGNRPEKADVRVICATHQHLPTLCREGRFREDLFYRLSVVPIHIPPLRERMGDVAELAEFFLRQAEKKGLGSKQLERAALALLEEWHWPGNVRELEHCIYRLCALTPEATIRAETVASVRQPQTAVAKDDSATLEDAIEAHLRTYFRQHLPGLPPGGLYDRILHLMEGPLLRQSLHATGGNQIRAAELLGINRNTLRKKIRERNVSLESVSDGANDRRRIA